MNEDEFDRLVFENQGIIRKICKAFCPDEEGRKDLFQDILVKLWKGRDLFEGRSKISTWIYRIGLNEAIDLSRKSKKMMELHASIDDKMMNKEKYQSADYDIEALYLAINQLNPLEKGLILLHLEQEPYSKISEVIGISEKNVSVRLVRIKEKLKKYYLIITGNYHGNE